MRWKINSVLIGLVFLNMALFAQTKDYNYARPLSGLSAPWHSIVLPKEIFAKVRPDLSDIRVLGVTDAGDTIEAPYLTDIRKGETTKQDREFKIINTSYNSGGYYFTFEVPEQEMVNQIILDLQQQNFDWWTDLEGSHDQREWFTVLKKYRILSISNNQTNYRFTRLSFPDTKYTYYRVRIRSKISPTIDGISLQQLVKMPPDYEDYYVINLSVNEDKDLKQTIVDFSLEMPLPVSYLKVSVADTIDYYRPVTISALTDSTETANGTKYFYNTIASGTLSSLEDNLFVFNSEVADRYRITIENHDNRPLKVEGVTAKGYRHDLIVRTTDQAKYYLVYGSETVGAPNYDLAYFKDNVPDDPAPFTPGEEMQIEKAPVPVVSPLFENKAWLWAIMGVVILLLGWFSIKMISNKAASPE